MNQIRYLLACLAVALSLPVSAQWGGVYSLHAAGGASTDVASAITAPCSTANAILYNAATPCLSGYTLSATAGEGPSFATGTAASNVAAFSVTRTNNSSAITKGVEITFTDGTSASGFLPLAIRGGAAGLTDLLTLGKAGELFIGGSVSGVVYTSAKSLLSYGVAGFRSNAGAVVSNASYYGFTAGSNIATSDPDLTLSRISAGVVGVGTGAAGSVAGTLEVSPIHSYGVKTSATDYSRLAIKHATTTLTSVTGASVTATGLIPAKAKMLGGVNTKITVALGETGGTTGYAVGTAGDPNLWGDVVGVATTVASGQADATADPVLAWSASAQDVVITAAGGNFDGTGSIFIDVAYVMTEAD